MTRCQLSKTRHFEPQILHGSFMLAHSQMADNEEAILAEAKDHMAAVFASKLAPELLGAKGGVILSPVTWTVNNDEQFGMALMAGTVNMLRLPDPEEDLFYLYGGRMHGRAIRVGSPAPATYRIPWVPPVTVYAGEKSIVMEYRRVPGATAYEFVSEWTV